MKFPILGKHRRAFFQSLEIIAPLLLFAATGLRAAVMPAVTSLGSLGAPLQAPARVAVDSAGRALVSDSQSGRIVVFDAFGRLSQIKTGFAAPLGIATDSDGNILVAESQAGRVSVFDSQWNLIGSLGAGDGEFTLPNFIAVDPEAGSKTVFVSDSAANRIKVYTNGVAAFSFGTAGTDSGQFDFPTGIFATTNELFVVDQNNGRMQVFDHAGNYLREFNISKTTGSLGALSGRCQGMMVDDYGRVYVADAFQDVIRVFDTAGTSLGTIGSFGSAPGQLRSPFSVAMDRFNRLFVASPNNGRVEIYGLDSCFHLTSNISGRFAPAGTNLVLAVIASGGGTNAWQWQKNGTNLVDGGTVSGALAASLAITSLASGDSGAYSVIINGSLGSFTINADPLTVLIAPSIIASPTNRIVAQGGAATFSVSAAGDALAYQWMHNGSSISGATNASLTIMDAQPGDRGGYAVVVQNPVGQITSDGASLAVVTPPVIVHHPTDMTVIQGDTAAFFSLAQGDGVSYQWQFNGTNLTDANFNALQIAGAQPAEAGSYNVIAANIAGIATSSVANLNILVPPAVNSVGEAVMLSDGTVQLSLFGIDGYTYALDASIDLATWMKLGNIATTSGLATVVDMDSTNAPLRFYRLRWKP